MLAVAVNGLLFVWDLRGGDAGQRNRADFPLLPAAWVIGAVWTVLLSAMACVQSRVLQRTQEPALQQLVPILFANCMGSGLVQSWALACQRTVAVHPPH